MLKPTLLAATILLVTSPTLAQKVVELPDRYQTTNEQWTFIDGSRILFESESGRAALEDFHHRKAAGELPIQNKSSSVIAVGDTVTFTVFNFETSEVERRDFVWIEESALVNIWVDVLETSGPGGNGNVTDASAQSLVSAMEDSTPADSYNPNAGILANNIAIFGDVPNVDGDGKTDILLFDIQEVGCCALGYVSANDLSPTGGGNNRDILYLDSNEGIKGPSNRFLGAAAHELQHLIHFNYSTSEETFVNEGLSEYASIINGLEFRNIVYPTQTTEQKISLFTWDRSAPEFDYQRANLLTTYLAERTDVLTVGSITRDPANGRRGYENAVEGIGSNFQALLMDFHTATLLNGTGVSSDPRYGFRYTTHANARSFVEPSAIVDGRTVGNTARRDTINGGAVMYRVWTDVEDFTLTAAPFVEPGQTRDLTLGRAALRAIVERTDGTVEITDLDVEPTDVLFPGLIDRLTLIFVHTKPVSSGAIGVSSDRLIYDYSAEWLGAEFSTEFTQYEDGQPDIFLSIPDPQHFSTRFELSDPERTTLDVVSIAIYYSNQFSGGPPDESPRDFTLEVRADTNGAPGRLLFSKVMSDPRASEDVFQGQPLRFLDIDLSNEDIPELTPAIHVGAANAGTDDNTIVTGIANYDVANVTHLSGDGGDSWAAMWDVSLSDGTSLNGKMSAVRLQVLIRAEPVAIEDEPELPEQLQLAQNFPNPFNPTTTVRYSLPATANVTLTVYDILGRQMGVFPEGPMPAGQHEVVVDASRWASGMYVYVLAAGETRLTRQMVLLK